MCSSCCNRRKLLKRSLQAISLLALGSCQKSSSLVSPIDLRAQESSKIQADTLQVLAVRGIAQTQKLLKVGDQVFSGEVVELDKDSEVILGAPDQSAFQLNSYAKVQPILEKEGGQINLERGSVTVAITQKRNRKYQLRMPALQVGVRGTVFHAEADWLGKPNQAYFCLCYGQADLQGDNGEELLPLSARYHTAVVGRADEENTVIQPLDLVANHDDPGIKRIIELGNVPHEMSWLRL